MCFACLGSSLGVPFEPSWAPKAGGFRSKTLIETSLLQTSCSSFHEAIQKPSPESFFDPRADHISAQETRRPPQEGLEQFLFASLLSFSISFGFRFCLGVMWLPLWPPKTISKSRQNSKQIRLLQNALNPKALQDGCGPPKVPSRSPRTTPKMGRMDAPKPPGPAPIYIAQVGPQILPGASRVSLGLAEK